MGLPLHAWSNETFETIVKGIDANLVRQDEITEEWRSFSVVKLLIDCFQWEPIQEWITVICDDVIFDVYIKEFGEEMLTRLVHPDGFDSEDAVVENSTLPSMASIHVGGDGGEGERKEVVETPRVTRDAAEGGALMQNIGENNLMNGNPTIKKRTEEGLGLSDGRMEEGLGLADLFGQCSPNTWVGPSRQMTHENQEWAVTLGKNSGLLEDDIGESNETSCPFPPGFGPCNDELHIHSEFGSGQGNDEVVSDAALKHVTIGNPNPKCVSSELSKDKNDHEKNQEDRTEALVTRSICHDGGLFLRCNDDDVLLRDLIKDKTSVANANQRKQGETGGGSRGRGRRRVMLASSKRILQSAVRLNSK
ncbi:hypothetical protein PIB30_011231 [Stylosanthes scabra]|uniref:DUF4283 domain-containing protein n=1 Tax=Stylosanthes scabra TaxID=79078 RepID=A0ABU6T5J9_9FABA|nr:hypothetical protein [Stylosanthes scabra]